MKEIKLKHFILASALLLLFVQETYSAATDVTIVFDDGNSKFTCVKDGGSTFDYDRTTNLCSTNIERSIQWWRPAIMGATAVSAATANVAATRTTILDNATIDISIIYETVFLDSNNFPCGYTDSGGTKQDGVIDIRLKTCVSTVATPTTDSATLTTANKAQRLGAPYQVLQAAINYNEYADADTTAETDKIPACWLSLARTPITTAGYIDKTDDYLDSSATSKAWTTPYNDWVIPFAPSVSAAPHTTAQNTAYLADRPQWGKLDADSNNLMTCDGMSMTQAFTHVRYVDRPVVDLLKFQCYLPFDCIPRPLEIDVQRWLERPTERYTDAHMYHCMMMSTDQSTVKDHNKYVAQGFTLIGDPAHITGPNLTASNNFIIRFADKDVNNWTCETGTTTKVYYNFDPYRGICYKFESATPDVIDIMHIFYQTYDLSKLEGLQPLLKSAGTGLAGDGFIKAWFDIYNGKCVQSTAVDGVGTLCEGHKKFDIYLKNFVYICDCTSTKTYYTEDDATIFALGRQTGNSWSCANEVVQVDLVLNKCYKGQYTLTFDADRYWCGGIPLAIHRFDIINWPGRDTGMYLVDLFNGLCKVYDSTTEQLKPFERLRTIPRGGSGKAANLLSEFVCEDPWTGLEGIKFTNTATTTLGNIFGDKIWVPDSETAANTFTATVGRIDLEKGADGAIWIADDSTFDQGTARPDYAATFAGTAGLTWNDQFNFLGKLDTDWGTVVDRESGYYLWNTFNWAEGAAGTTIANVHDTRASAGGDAGAAVLADATVWTAGKIFLLDWQGDFCMDSTYAFGTACVVTSNRVSHISSIINTQHGFTCNCDSTKTADTETQLISANPGHTIINKERYHNWNYYDDVMRIVINYNLDTIPAGAGYVYKQASTCERNGMTYDLKAQDMTCHHQTDPQRYRKNEFIWTWLQFNNYKVTDMFFDTRVSKNVFIDFVANTCQFQESPQILELVIDNTTFFPDTGAIQQGAELPANAFKCKGYWPDGFWANKSVEGYKMTYLGHNYTRTWNVAIDLKNKTCTKTETQSADTTITVTDFQITKQFCYGKFYYPIWINNFSIDKTTAHEYLDQDTTGKIAILDIKNNKCYIKDQTDLCDLTNTPTNSNTENEDVQYKCDCTNNPSATEYYFSKKYETNLNFIFMGYKYIDIHNNSRYEGLSTLTQILDKDPFTIKLFENGAAYKTDSSLYKNGVKYDSFDLETGAYKKLSTDTAQYIALADYNIDFTYWHKAARTSNWVIDWNQMKCYRRGSCNVYLLKQSTQAAATADRAAAEYDYSCEHNGEVYTTWQMGVPDVELFKGMVVADSKAADITGLIVDYVTQLCTFQDDAYAGAIDADANPDNHKFYARYNLCATALTGVFIRIGTVDTANGGSIPDASIDLLPQSRLAATAGTELYVDWRNGLQCHCGDGTYAALKAVNSNVNGDVITCDQATACTDVQPMSIKNNYLRGHGLQIIGYQPELPCDTKYYLDLVNNKCFMRGYEFTFDATNFRCTDQEREWFADADLRQVEYEILVWPVNILYVVDYHQSKCLSPGGNEAHLQYVQADNSDANNVIAAKTYCKRLSINGWEVFDADNTAQVAKIGQNESKYGSSALTYYVNLQDVSCWKVAVGTSAGGISIGDFYEESGTCVADEVVTAYVSYNKPTFSGTQQYITSNTIDILYIFSEGKEYCATSQQQDLDKCAASISYNYGVAAYPQMTFNCKCDTQDNVQVLFDDFGSKVITIGPVPSRYFSGSWYYSLDLDPVEYQCHGNQKWYNYNAVTESCYFGSKRLHVYRQFYEIFNWNKGTGSDVVLVDHFKQGCYHPTDCTPMKYSHKKTYNHDNDSGASATADVTNAYCRRVINEDIGFLQRFDQGKYYEFGRDYNKDASRIISNIFRQTLKCQNQQGADLNIWFDQELQSCIDLDKEKNDFPVHEIQTTDNSVVLNALANDDYMNWDYNVVKGMTKKQFVFPSLNQCAINMCSDVNTDGTCNSGRIQALGYLRYTKDHEGKVGWFCEADITRQQIDESDAYFFGTGTKHISNRCASLDSVYGGRRDISGYWILVQLVQSYATDSQCLMLYPKPASTTWVIDQNVYIPQAQYHADNVNGYNDLSGTQTGTLGTNFNFVGEYYSVGKQKCNNTILRQYQYTIEQRQTTVQSIWDWVSMKCYIFDLIPDAPANAKYKIFNIKPLLNQAGKYYCDVDPLTGGNPAATLDLYATPLDNAYVGISTDYTKSSGSFATGTLLVPTVDQKFLSTYTIKIEVSKGRSRCYRYTSYQNTESWNFYDDRLNICDYDIDVSKLRKVPDVDWTTYKAFIDLGLRRCHYGRMSGHLIEFNFDANKFYAPNYNVAIDRTNQSLNQDFDDFVYSIKCRWYDNSTVPGTFSIKEFTFAEVLIGGLEKFLRFPEETYTSNLDVYLIKPQATSLESTISFTCGVYEDNSNLYNPMAPFNSANFPTSGLETYTRQDHKCGATSLIGEYYMVVIDSSFPYDAVIDVFGDRCFLKTGEVWKLRYDDFGRPNACLDPADEDHRQYIYFNFKSYNAQKTGNKLISTTIPNLPNADWNKSTDLVFNTLPDVTKLSCDNTNPNNGAGEERILYPELAMCLDLEPTLDTWHNLCVESVAQASVKDTVVPFAKDNYQYQGAIDLCRKECHINDDTGAAILYWKLTFLNEFEITCTNPNDKNQKITRYNEEYWLYGDRGQYFSLKAENDFKIKRITLDLTLTSADKINWDTMPVCYVEGDTPAAGWSFHYRQTSSNLWCYQSDWYCETWRTSGKIDRLYFSDPDNHFTVKTIYNDPTDAVSTTYPFFPLGKDLNLAPLRYQCLVDVFNGKCYFPNTPDIFPTAHAGSTAQQIDPELTGRDIELDTTVKTIFASIDNFTQEQVDTIIFECGPKRKFKLHEILFLGYENKINVPTCPKGTFKHPETGVCEHCMYECDDCESKFRCEDCRDIPQLTDIYLPCGDRCFSHVIGATDRQDYANLSNNKVWWDATAGVQDAERCKQCDWNCIDCDTDIKCTSCEQGYVLFEQDATTHYCISYEVCNEKYGYYANIAGGTCSTCDTNCQDCSGSAVNCIECQNGKLIQKIGETHDSCISPCGDYFYEDSVMSRCLRCNESCSKCGDNLVEGLPCTITNNNDGCNTGFYAHEVATNDVICTDLCRYGWYVDTTVSTTLKCQKCHHSCAGCDGKDPTDCTYCPFNRVYHDLRAKTIDGTANVAARAHGECITECPFGWFEYTKYMKNDPTFKFPTNPVQRDRFVNYQPPDVDCLYAYENYDYEFDQVPQFCHPCHDTCNSDTSACEGPNANHCLTCDSGWFMRFDSDGARIGCVQECSQGEWKRDSDQTCQKCSTDFCERCEPDGDAGNLIDKCTKCEENTFFDPVNKKCSSVCGEGFYANKQTMQCIRCDTSLVTTCKQYATKATGCHDVFAKPKLNTITNTCVAACPAGTWDDNNTCRTCGQPECDCDGNPSGTCDDNCATCHASTKCLTCNAGFLLLLDTETCLQATECPEGYRHNPGNNLQCQKCGLYEKTCGISGAIECLSGVCDANAPVGSPVEIEYVLKGWPIKQCVLNTATNDCDDGWYEKDLKCYQCSNHCATCTDSKYFCTSCPDTTTIQYLPIYTLPNSVMPYCFQKNELARLCLCDIGMTSTFDKNYMKMTITFPADINVDWNYYLANKEAINNDKTIKTRDTLGTLMKNQFNTKELVTSVNPSEITTFQTDFEDLYQYSRVDVISSNKAFEEKQRAIIYPAEGEYVSEVAFNEGTQFGEQEAGEDLLQVLFEYQNWSMFGDYTYRTSFTGGNKVITITMGQDHLFDIYTNPLVLREKIIRKTGCPHPYQQIQATTTDPASLPNPIVSISTDFGGSNKVKAQVAKCGRPEFVITFQGFPKGVPKIIKWTLFDDLQRIGGTPDNNLRIALESSLSQIPPQLTKYTLPAEFAAQLEGYTAHIRVEAYAFFTEYIAISTISLDFLQSGNYKLQFANQLNEFRFKRILDQESPSISMILPPCLLTEQTEAALYAQLEFSLTFFTYTENTKTCTATAYTPSKTITFNKATKTIEIPAETFPDTTKVCAKLTGPTNAGTGMDSATLDILLIPEHIFPLVTTTFGNYLEQDSAQDLVINFSQVFDKDQTITNIWECKTVCGKSCDYLNADGNPRSVRGTFADITAGSQVDRSLTIAANQLEETKIYKITIFAKYNQLIGQKTIDVKMIPKSSTLLKGEWIVFGVNSQGFGLAGKEGSFKVVFPEAIDPQRDTFTWIYEQIDTDGQWQVIPQTDTTLFKQELNHFVIAELAGERNHRVTLRSKINGKEAESFYEFSTLSGIDIEFTVTPLIGTTSVLYTFAVERISDTNEQLEYKWQFFNSDGVPLLLGNTVQDVYQNYLPKAGDGENSILGIQLQVTNKQKDTKRVYKSQVQITKGSWSPTALTGSPTLDQSIMIYSAVSQVTQQTKENIDAFDAAVTNSLTLLDRADTIQFEQYKASVRSNIQILGNNLQVADEYTTEFIKEKVNLVISADPAIDADASTAILTENLVIQNVKILTVSDAKRDIEDFETMFSIFENKNSADPTGFTLANLADEQERLDSALITKLSAASATLVKGESFSIKTKNKTINNLKVSSKTPRRIRFSSSDLTQARRLQDTATETTTDTNATTDAVKNYNCESYFLMGPSTLSEYDNLVVSVIVHTRDSLKTYFKEKTEEGGVGTPFCDPVQVAFHQSSNSGSGASVTIINFDAKYDAQRYSVCFVMDETFVIADWFGVTVRNYDRATNNWVELGAEDVQETSDESRTYCQWVTKTGYFAPFEKVNENDARLYAGFILYVMFGIDVYLVICIIIGCRMDKKQKRIENRGHKGRTSVLGEKEYSGVETNNAEETPKVVQDDAVKEEGGEEEKNDTPVHDPTSNEDSTKQLTAVADSDDKKLNIKEGSARSVKSGAKGPAFCKSFLLYHRAINVCTSTYHVLKGPARSFSFALQFAILCNLVGLLTFALDFGNTAAEATVGYIICFIILRLVNFLFYKGLLWGQKSQGAANIVIIVIFAIVLILCHVSAVLVTLYMEDSDFTAWTLAFIVTTVVDLVIWELIVTCWQMSAIRVKQQGKVPCCEWQVSVALKNFYNLE